MCWAVFKCLKNNIEEDNAKYHFQYRSPLSNVVYNSILRPDEDWLIVDFDISMNFIFEEYDESYTFLAYLYDDKSIRSNLESRIRNMELPLIEKINDKYKELYKLMYNSCRRKFDMRIIECEGTMDSYNNFIEFLSAERKDAI
jgi:hypothetical protein